MKRFIANILILIGISCYVFVGYSVYDRVNPRRIAFADGKYAKVYQTENRNLYPVQLKIAKSNILLPVIPSVIKKGKWEATTEGISYLSSTALPGEKGNSVFYGHNWPSLLGKLTDVRPGDNIEIILNDKTRKIFEVEYTVTVTPDQTHILESSNDSRITVYTCSGFLDLRRFVVVGILREDLLSLSK